MKGDDTMRIINYFLAGVIAAIIFFSAGCNEDTFLNPGYNPIMNFRNGPTERPTVETYFGLSVGNSWVYRLLMPGLGSDTSTTAVDTTFDSITVVQKIIYNGKEYFRCEGGLSFFVPLIYAVGFKIAPVYDYQRQYFLVSVNDQKMIDFGAYTSLWPPDGLGVDTIYPSILIKLPLSTGVSWQPETWDSSTGVSLGPQIVENDDTTVQVAAGTFEHAQYIIGTATEYSPISHFIYGSAEYYIIFVPHIGVICRGWHFNEMEPKVRIRLSVLQDTYSYELYSYHIQ